MPSLRRSLILYFLILVGLALGGLGLLVDRFASGALAARLKAESDRIEAEHESAIEKAREKFDADLLAEAKQLARDYRNRLKGVADTAAGPRPFEEPRRSDENRKAFESFLGLMPLGDLGNGWATVTAAALATPLPQPVGMNPPPRTLHPFLAARVIVQAQYMLAVAREPFERARAEFALSGDHAHLFQLHLAARDPRDRQPLHSPRLPVEWPTDLPPADTSDHWYEDAAVPGVGAVRKVTFRASFSVSLPPTRVFGFPGFGTRPGGGGGRPGGDRPGGPGGGDRPNGEPRGPQPGGALAGFPPLVVQVAQPKDELTAALAAIDDKRDEQLTTTTTDSRDALHRLRLHLAAIGGGTFLAVVLGCWLLIGFGLAPLRKLSDAMSHINEKDFRLPVEKQDLTTELAPIHDRLTQSLDALRRAFDREKEAVADISHELRTPVAGMLATLDVALRRPRTAEQYKETLTECRAIAKQLGGLVERVMTLAYLDAGHGNAQPVPTDVSELAGGCAAVIRPLAAAHGLTLDTDLPSAAEISTDPDRLREVLMNLLHNAIEYNRPGGRITLRAAREGNGMTVEVADTGIGMTEDVKGKIFDRFFRADPSRTATGAHAGLGLAIVKEAVNRLGGTIAVDSTPAVGTTFRVRLPG